MIKTKNMYLALVAVLLAPMAANADPIAYDFTGTSETGWSITGEVVLDDGDATPGDNLVAAFISWSFSWTNGIEIFTLTSLDSIFFGEDYFVIDELGAVFEVLLCTNSCGAFDTSHIVTLDYWDATTGPGDGETVECCVGDSTGAWSGPRAVSVPEPGTLALLSIGLLGMGAARRRKKT